jgi:hypothetical protein
MMKRYLLLGIIFLITASAGTAQDTLPKFKIAIFAPLYLDSAFDETDEYRYARTTFPKFLNPGLEFYEGAQLALDSLNQERVPVEVFIYDTRSSKESLADQLSKAERDSVSLIIAHSSSSEIKVFADAGLKSSTPIINVNMPNDGGVTGNPFFVILNPTLRTQVEGIYRYIQKFYSLNPIVVFRKKGQLEDRIKGYLDDFSKNTMGIPLKLKYVDLTDSFSINQVRAHLDTSSQTLCVAGSLDENFGRRLVQQLATLKKSKYESIVMGMPTWDNIRDFSKPEYKGIEIIYSDPFYNAKVDKVSQSINNYFNKVMFARPSDMVFRGYEVTWKYLKLLMQYGKDLGSNISSKLHKVFTDYDIQPILNKQTMTLDYFENKKLYFVKLQDGVLKALY